MAVVYFVCHGNTCRSPMAAEILRRMLMESKMNGTTVDSFGTNPYYPDNTEVRNLREYAVNQVMGGGHITGAHRPKGIEGIDVKTGDKIVMLAPKDLSTLSGQLRAVSRSPEPIVWDIEDPFRKPQSKYIEVAQTMKTAIERNFNLLVRD